MSVFFWIDPRIIVSALSMSGCLYFLYVCLRESKILFTHQQYRRKATTEQTSQAAQNISAPQKEFYKVSAETSWPFLSKREISLPKALSSRLNSAIDSSTSLPRA